MSNFRIVWDNKSDAATLSATPALVATLPETHLQQAGRANVARTTSTADQAIKGNFAAAGYVSSMILWRHNLSPDATVRLRLYSGAGQTGTLLYDSTAVAPYSAKAFGDLLWGIDPFGDSVFTEWGIYWSTLWFTPVAALSFQLDLSDSANTDGYMQAARLIIGPTLTGVNNASYNYAVGWQEDTRQERTAGGSLRSDAADPFREFKIPLNWIEASDRPKLLEMRRRVGMRQDFFFSLFPEVGGSIERDHSAVVKLVQADPLTAPYYGNHTHELSMQEA